MYGQYIFGWYREDGGCDWDGDSEVVVVLRNDRRRVFKDGGCWVGVRKLRICLYSYRMEIKRTSVDLCIIIPCEPNELACTVDKQQQKSKPNRSELQNHSSRGRRMSSSIHRRSD